MAFFVLVSSRWKRIYDYQFIDVGTTVTSSTLIRKGTRTADAFVRTRARTSLSTTHRWGSGRLTSLSQSSMHGSWKGRSSWRWSVRRTDFWGLKLRRGMREDAKHRIRGLRQSSTSTRQDGASISANRTRQWFCEIVYAELARGHLIWWGWPRTHSLVFQYRSWYRLKKNISIFLKMKHKIEKIQRQQEKHRRVAASD